MIAWLRTAMWTAVSTLLVMLAACHTERAPPGQQLQNAAISATDDAGAETSRRDAPSGPASNLVFVMIDTLRADHLGVAGYRHAGASLTPNLDRFAATATYFTHGYAQAPNTPRSFPSMMTSRLPGDVIYDKSFHNFPTLRPDNVMLFEALSKAGLETAGFSSHFYFAPRRNATQGFAEYDNRDATDIAGSNKDYAAPRIVPRAIARLDAFAASHQQFAMFVHLFEPHSSYVDHSEFPVTTVGEQGLADRYDGEIAVCDGWVGKLLDRLTQNKLDGNTVVVIVSDHGESFGAHVANGQRAFFHGRTLYDGALRVPILIRVPGLAGTVQDDRVALIDVAPTILDVLGLPAEPTFTGRSLVPLLRGQSLPPRDVRAQLMSTPDTPAPLEALITGDTGEKIIIGSDRVEVYDLTKDPHEHNNLVDRDPSRAARLRAKLLTAP